MPERSIRFGVTDGRGNRAATWKLWTQTGSGKSDVYLACRALGGTLKASLHESGNWHIAYTQRAFAKDVAGAIAQQSDRFMEKWPRPKHISDGVTLAYRIVTPYSAVTSPISDSEAQIICIPNAPEPKATEIDIIITALTTSVTGWPGKRSLGTSLVGSFQRENGQIVWAVHWVIDMPDLSSSTKGNLEFYKGRGPEDMESDNMRALVFGKEKDGSRVIYDCAVQRRATNNSVEGDRA